MERQGDRETRGHGDKSPIPNPQSKIRNRERGQVLAWVVFLLPLLIALTGLVLDGGLMWAQFRRARWAADGAAVAAASEIDYEVFAESGQVIVTEQALWTALYYAQQNDPNLWIDTIYTVDGVVYVEGRVEIEPVFLALFGVGEMELHVRGRERPAWGIEQEGE